MKKVKKNVFNLRELQDRVSRSRATHGPLSPVPGTTYATPSVPTNGDTPTHRPNQGIRGKPGSLTIAIPSLISSLEKNEGYRIGILGESGAGKTSAIKHFLAIPFDGVTLIHDEKAGNPQFDGYTVQYANIASVPDNVDTVVFRGDPYNRTTVEVNSVALLALKLARLRIPVRLVIDELDRAVTDGGRALNSPAVRECITQGRAMKLCVLWSTQLPQRAPVEMLDNASAIVLGRCGPRAVNYLDQRCFFTDDETASIKGLKTHYEDNRTVGELVVHRNGKPWDGRVYSNE